MDRAARGAPLPVDSGLVKVAAELGQRDRIWYWDAAIIAAAESLDAEIVCSEDLDHGRRYGRVRILNPFVA